MVQSNHWKFSDPFSYQRTIRAADVQIVLKAKGEFRAELTRVDFSRLWMLRSHESLPRISHAANPATRSPIFFHTELAQASIRHTGLEVSPSHIVAYSPSATHYHRSEGPTRWGSMSLTNDDLATMGFAITGRDMVPPKATHLVRPNIQNMDRLRALHNVAGWLARTSPTVLDNAELARALENALLHAMIVCLAESSPAELTSGGRHHRAIISRFEQFLAENPDRPSYLAEVCAAVGASQTVLRVVCQEHLGMGPMRYLWLRRMHLVRRALLRATPGATTVTEVAMNFGFWELGRFSVAYRRLFGELPLASLHRPPRELPGSDGNPFALPAAESA